MSEPGFSYDEVPYSSFTFPQSRPDRLATLAAFHGMSPAAPDNCRVLELGCGDGTNLLSFAYNTPQSKFVGIDLAKAHIDEGKAAANEFGLNNIEFHCEDVMNLSRENIGEFDYIIAHGLFSWVPEFVRGKILGIFSECLAPQGVGYISYNVYPGCKIREMFWDMMKYFTAEVDNPMQKVAGGVQFLNFLNFAGEKDTAYHDLLNTELSQYLTRTPENIFHDDLSANNQPFYFHEFVEMIKPQGLQFLSEVDAYWTESKLRPEISGKLDELGDDIVKREQITDFISGRRFRSSLLCKDTIKLDRNPGENVVHSFFLASQLEPLSPEPDLTSDQIEKFKGLDNEVIETGHPMTKAALHYLQNIWSRYADYDEVARNASELSGQSSENDRGRLTLELMKLFKQGHVSLHRLRPNFPHIPSEKPKSSRFVQWQIRKKCSNVTALSGMNLHPESDLMRLILLLCDGTRDRDALLREVSRRIEFREANREEMLSMLPKAVDEKLTEFARLGLFEA